MTDVDDIWDDDPYDDDPGEPCWGCWHASSGTCWSCGGAPPLKVRRRLARRWRQWRRVWRTSERHANDRFWQARNRHLFDEEAPF